MKKTTLLIAIPLLLGNHLAQANDEAVFARQQAIILEKFPGAEFTEIEKDRHKGKDIYEYEFTFKGKAYEAFLTADDRILRMGLD